MLCCDRAHSSYIHTLRLFFTRVFSPHLSNVSIYFQFIDMYAYCTIAEFVLQYSHKDKSRRQLALTTASSKTNGLLSALACMDMISLYPRFFNFRWGKDSAYGFFQCNRPRSLAARGRTMRMRTEQLRAWSLEMRQASQLELPRQRLCSRRLGGTSQGSRLSGWFRHLGQLSDSLHSLP